MLDALNLGIAPHTVTVYNRATNKVLIYLYYEYYPKVTEWGQYPTLNDQRWSINSRLNVHGLGFRTQSSKPQTRTLMRLRPGSALFRETSLKPKPEKQLELKEKAQNVEPQTSKGLIYLTLGIKIAQKPYIARSLGPKALIYESLDP